MKHLLLATALLSAGAGASDLGDSDPKRMLICKLTDMVTYGTNNSPMSTVKINEQLDVDGETGDVSYNTMSHDYKYWYNMPVKSSVSLQGIHLKIRAYYHAESGMEVDTLSIYYQANKGVFSLNIKRLENPNISYNGYCV